MCVHICICTYSVRIYIYIHICIYIYIHVGHAKALLCLSGTQRQYGHPLSFAALLLSNCLCGCDGEKRHDFLSRSDRFRGAAASLGYIQCFVASIDISTDIDKEVRGEPRRFQKEKGERGLRSRPD